MQFNAWKVSFYDENIPPHSDLDAQDEKAKKILGVDGPITDFSSDVTWLAEVPDVWIYTACALIGC